ncbi:MAG: hypothetical protein KatS3mg111_3527 [Pirellulaceae bacterium]|nr:MAG: hypothetical protein KatS3mg111_3527 [Pirellulaceae bacterium]
MLYLIAGLGIFLFAVVQLGEMVVRVQLTGWLKRRDMMRALGALQDHFIICGCGRMGHALGEQLHHQQKPFVVIDRDDKVLEECDQLGWQFVSGDATDDRVLESAGVKRARGIAVVMDADADNLFTVLSARLLAPQLQIVARATDQAAAKKMERAGANRVVCLHAAGARTMAQFMVNPSVEDFFEVFSSLGTAIDLAELRLDAQSVYVGQRLKDTDFQDRGIVVVAIRRANGRIEIPPTGESLLQVGDRLIALGDASAISRFLAADRSSAPDR